MEIEQTMKQAPATIDCYFSMAVDSIDKKFGKGYAKAHPEMVSGYINACVKDYTAVRLEEIGNAIFTALTCISDSIDNHT